MVLPPELQGDPVQFYKELKNKLLNKSSRKDSKDGESESDSVSKSSPDTNHERKGSKKGLRRKSSLGVISENAKKGERAVQSSGDELKSDSELIDAADNTKDMSENVENNVPFTEELNRDTEKLIEDSNNNEKNKSKETVAVTIMQCEDNPEVLENSPKTSDYISKQSGAIDLTKEMQMEIENEETVADAVTADVPGSAENVQAARAETAQVMEES